MVTQQRLHRIYNRLCKAVVLLAAIFVMPIQTLQAELTASVDRTQISKNDIIQLTLRSDKGPIAHSDFSELEANFSIINRQRTQQEYNINGSKTISYGLKLGLFPIDAGVFTIPAFHSQGDSSQPIQVTVTNNRSTAGLAHEEVFLKVTPDQQQVYVQQPFMLTVQLYHSVGLRDAQLSPLEIPNAIINSAGKQTKTEKIINGVRYSVIEKRYSVTPEKSGELTIPELSFLGRSVDNSFYNQPSRYLRSRSLAHHITVLPKPTSYPANTAWLPTPALSLTDSWSNDVPELTVGDSVTRTLTLSALNLEAAQLPDLPFPEVANLKMYPDQTRNEDNPTASGIVGQRIFSIAVVATQAGEFETPPLTITWWNTKTQQLEETRIPARKLRVIAVPNAIAQNNSQQLAATPGTQTQASNQPTGFWPYLTGIFALLWLATLFLWWKKAPRAAQQAASMGMFNDPNEQSERAGFKAFKKACQSNQARPAKTALLNWFKTKQTTLPTPCLSGIASYYQNEELETILSQLENHLYSQTPSNWQGQKLLQLIETLEKDRKKGAKSQRKNDLQPLYPL